MLPAYAGMIRHRRLPFFSILCAPRVCGDDPRRLRPAWRETPVLPAYAGMIPEGLDLGADYMGAPRVCGDDPGPYEVVKL